MTNPQPLEEIQVPVQYVPVGMTPDEVRVAQDALDAFLNANELQLEPKAVLTNFGTIGTYIQVSKGKSSQAVPSPFVPNGTDNPPTE